MADVEQMQLMLTVIERGLGLEEARRRGLVRTEADEELFRRLEAQAEAIRARGGEVEIPSDLF